MMVLKCDVCGGCFNFEEDTYKTRNYIEIGYMNKGGLTYNSGYKHLCPDCMAAVMKALDDRKEVFSTHDGVEM